MNAREKLFKEIKSATPASARMIRMSNSLAADMKKVLGAWTEDQPSHNIPFSPSLIQGKALALLNIMNEDRGKSYTRKA